MEKTIKVTILIDHFVNDHKETVVRYAQLVNGAGDMGFTCLVKDVGREISRIWRSGQMSLQVDKIWYEYKTKNNLKMPLKCSEKWHKEKIAAPLSRIGLKLSHDIHEKINYKARYGAKRFYSK